MDLIHDIDGEIEYQIDFLSRPEADDLLQKLLVELRWQQEFYQMFGREVASPRLVAWYGDEGAEYSYSGKTHIPLPWHPDLRGIRDTIQQMSGASFNAVLANLYRNGRDYMGWHADNEHELGPEPVIASLSLGAERIFRIQHRKTKQKHDWTLAHGSLLVMRGCLQRYWRHTIPRQLRVTDPRINLTYRFVHSP